MKRLVTLGFLGIYSLVHSQPIDSTILHQVDSLVQVTRDLVSSQKYQEALQIIKDNEPLAASIGEVSATFGQWCFNHGMILDRLKDVDAAETWYIKARDILEQELGKDHADVASCLNNLGLLYQERREFAKAENHLLEARRIRRIVFGEESDIYSGTLTDLEHLYFAMREFSKALEMTLEIKSIREKVVGREDPSYSRSLNNLGLLYQELGEYEQAEKITLEAIALKEKLVGKEDPSYAKSLNNLGNLYRIMGREEEAIGVHLQTKVIWGTSLGTSHPLYGQSMYNVALCYSDLGQYEMAVRMWEQAKEIWAVSPGKEHSAYGQILNDLGTGYLNLGQFEAAEKIFIESLELRSKNPGRESLEYAGTLCNLALLYKRMGLFEQSEPIYLEAKMILESIGETNHRYYANVIEGLGSVYNHLGKIDQVESYLLQAKSIQETNFLGKRHLGYARSLNNLAHFYLSRGNINRAEANLLEAREIISAVVGQNHMYYAKTLGNLGKLYIHTGQIAQAETHFRECLSIMERSVGTAHHLYREALFDLSTLLVKGQDYNQAVPHLIELANMDHQLVIQAMHHLSERELHDYLQAYTESQDLLLSTVRDAGIPALRTICFDNALFYKGFLLQAAQRVKQLCLADSSATMKYYRLKGLERRLAAQHALPIVERGQTQIAALHSEAQAIEKELVRTVNGFAEAQTQVSSRDVQDVLLESEAVVEFVSYRYYHKGWTDSIFYAALVLRPGMPEPVFISLFEERSLDSLLISRTARKADYVNELYTLSDRGLQPEAGGRSSLVDLIWTPLKPMLTGTRKVFVSPSGLLHRINLNAIPVDLETSLMDQFNLVNLTSSRQLVLPAPMVIEDNKATLFGGVRYEMDSTALVSAWESDWSDALAQVRVEPLSGLDRSSRGAGWDYLPWTEREVATISITLKDASFQPLVRQGYQASEEAFMALRQSGFSPRILHLATHGFFFPDPEDTSSGKSSFGEDDSAFRMSDHPMIRSGLILAGGNQAWQNKPVPDGLEDGILTAYEISQMDLSNTELVVLSACETGLGDIDGNEGVYGLQRAFKIAGAKYLIMSLWQVPDRETMQFMTTFYRNWLEPGDGQQATIPEAFRKTQLEMRDRFFNPYSWAGFVLVE